MLSLKASGHGEMTWLRQRCLLGSWDVRDQAEEKMEKSSHLGGLSASGSPHKLEVSTHHAYLKQLQPFRTCPPVPGTIAPTTQILKMPLIYGQLMRLPKPHRILSGCFLRLYPLLPSTPPHTHTHIGGGKIIEREEGSGRMGRSP